MQRELLSIARFDKIDYRWMFEQFKGINGGKSKGLE